MTRGADEGLDRRGPPWLNGGMTLVQTLGAMAALYLVLLARSAWKQGELVQFARSLAIVAGLGAVLAAVVWTWIALDGP
jgi:hypothetical protein